MKEIWFGVSFLVMAYAIVFKHYYKNAMAHSVVIFFTILTNLLYLGGILLRKYGLMMNIELLSIIMGTGVLCLVFTRGLYSGGIFLIWSALMTAAYSLTIPYSTMLPSLLWLLIFITASDLKEISAAASRTIVKFAEVTFVFFTVRFALVDLGNHTMLLNLAPARIFTEVLSLMGLAYWMMSGTKHADDSIKKSINDMLEVFIIFALSYVFAEVNIVEQGISIAAFALLSLLVGPYLKSYNRLTIYSFMMFFIALFNVGFVSTSIASPSDALYDQVWFRSSITVVLATIFAVLGNMKLPYIAKEVTASNKLSAAMQRSLVKHGVNAIVYPLFLAIAVFLYRGFDRSMLSVLWMVECFALFIISLATRKIGFKKISMIGVAVIFARIIFYDLQGQDFLFKAVVFIVIGSILIVMNAIYNKYKYRYE